MTLDLPSAKDTARFGPTRIGYYDSVKTIEYQLRQIPKEREFSSKEWNVGGLFAPLSLGVSVAERRDCPAAEAGLTKVLLWATDMEALRNGAHVSLDEFSYDERGNVRRLGDHHGTVAGPSDGILFTGRGRSARSRPGSHREIEEHIVSTYLPFSLSHRLPATVHQFHPTSN